MLDRRVNVNEVDNLKNRTALHWSVASGNYEISKLLIEAGKSNFYLKYHSFNYIISSRRICERDRPRLNNTHNTCFQSGRLGHSSATHRKRSQTSSPRSCEHDRAASSMHEVTSTRSQGVDRPRWQYKHKSTVQLLQPAQIFNQQRPLRHGQISHSLWM